MSDALRRAARNVKINGRRAVLALGESIMTDSKQNFVPVDDGPLRDSGTVELVPDRIQVVLFYGGPAVPYALAVHEHLSEHSPESWKIAEAQGNPVEFSPSGRGPKFLERPLMNARNMAPEFLRQHFGFEGLVS